MILGIIIGVCVSVIAFYFIAEHILRSIFKNW